MPDAAPKETNWRRMSCIEDMHPVEPEISSVVFAVIDGDEANKNIRKRLMNEGTVIGQTSKDGKVMLKFTLLNPALTHEHIDRIIARIKELRV